MATKRRSKVYSISLPPEMAAKAEALAKQESRTMSELFREAFRTYQEERFRALMEETWKYARTRNPKGYTEEDIPRLIKETRAKYARTERAERKSA